ncbi:unnamed protein product [Victoria cruziana]
MARLVLFGGWLGLAGHDGRVFSKCGLPLPAVQGGYVTLGVHRLSRPFYRRYAPGLNWPGRASGAVTLKKLECSKQAYALYTLAWDNITGFRSYCVGLRDRSND